MTAYDDDGGRSLAAGAGLMSDFSNPMMVRTTPFPPIAQRDPPSSPLPISASAAQSTSPLRPQQHKALLPFPPWASCHTSSFWWWGPPYAGRLLQAAPSVQVISP